MPVRFTKCMDLCAYKNVVYIEGENGELWYGGIDKESDVAELAARIADWHHERYGKIENSHLLVGDGEVYERATEK